MEIRRRIMIVDDNVIDQMITTQVIKKRYENIEIIVKESEIAALSYLNEHQDNPDSLPSLILLDLNMPEMNGFGFLDKFKDLAARIKNSSRIIVLTSTDALDDIEMLKSHPNVSRLIFKPLNLSSLAPEIYNHY